MAEHFTLIIFQKFSLKKWNFKRQIPWQTQLQHRNHFLLCNLKSKLLSQCLLEFFLWRDLSYFKKRIIGIFLNNSLLHVSLKRESDSFIRFWVWSRSDWSYSLSATQKMIAFTKSIYEILFFFQLPPSKQWIHFLLSDLWPPTSIILIVTPLNYFPSHQIPSKLNLASSMPELRIRTLSMSCTSGI